MTIEIVDFPIENGGSFHSYVNVYQRVHPIYILESIEANYSLDIVQNIERYPEYWILDVNDSLDNVNLLNQIHPMNYWHPKKIEAISASVEPSDPTAQVCQTLWDCGASGWQFVSPGSQNSKIFQGFW